ncbi:MAG TPA: TIR domain-containing protein [Pyrinomonadaceae bacterium]|nr:TIR domain-containing protein [Pyrinomonadaceae bacterium]
MTLGTILLADNNKQFVKIQKPRLENEGYEVVAAYGPEAARRIIEEGQIDLAVLDLRLRDDSPDDNSGLELAMKTNRAIPKIILTKDPTLEAARWALKGSPPPAVDFIDKSKGTQELVKAIRSALKARVFIIHGRDNEARLLVKDFLEALGLTVVILHEQAWGGRTIIENFEKHSNVNFAVALLTPDDIGKSISDKHKELKPRARQNVIFELGFFIGKLGRDKVVVLYKNDPVRGPIEIPSDYQGVYYIGMDAAEGWKLPLAREIARTGIEIDLNRIVID